MKKDVFSYLNKNYRYLNNYVRDVNKTVIKYPHIAIKNGKMFATFLSKEVVRMENLNAPSTMSQADRLNLMRMDSDISTDIVNIFNSIRILGNDTINTSPEKNLEVSLKIHKSVYKLALWFVTKYLKSDIDVEAYKNPLTEADEENTDAGEDMQNLMDTMEGILSK